MTPNGMPGKEAPLILAIETATRAGSVSLSRGGRILSTVSGNASSSHSTDLLDNVDKVLRAAGLELSEVDLFAAASGPGSFTGLRIGLATVKSLAVCTVKKCIGVSTLAAIAHAAGQSDRNTVSLLPAGRGEVFAQMFSVAEDEIKSLDAPTHLSPGDLLKQYGHIPRLTWAGEGAQLHLESLRDWALAHDLNFIADKANGLPDGQEVWNIAPACDQLAASVALLALKEYENGNVLSPGELKATYVRPSDAEIPKPWRPQK